MKYSIKFIVVGIFIISQAVVAQQQKTPIMGWSSWNNYQININEEIILKQADAMVSSGLKAVGYSYINIDDGYFGGRDKSGKLFCDSIKFPNGMKHIADYIHSKGLKAGIYSEAGANTCGSIWNNDEKGIGVGLWEHDKQDLNLFFNDWGYDFLKVDWCGGEKQGLDEEKRYLKIINTVRDIKQDITFNICRWKFPGTWAINSADSWRISGDIRANFKSILDIIDKNTFLSAYAVPGHFNDMDMLQVGRGMTYEEDKAHFSMWCMMSSPLLAGNDLANMSKQTIEILTNTEIIAINQDVVGLQAIKKQDKDSVQLWVKPLGGRMSNTKAIAVLNTSDEDVSFTLDMNKVGLKNIIYARDVWKHENIIVSDDIIVVEVPRHGIVVYKLTGAEVLFQKDYEAENAYLNAFIGEHGNEAPLTLKPVENINASEGYVIKGLGGSSDNWIEFQHVFVEESGNYELVPSFVESGDVEFQIDVNGEKVDKSASSTGIIVNLKKGENKIRINNEFKQLPDFDKIQILNIKR